MEPTQTPDPQVQAALREFHEHRRLVTLIHTMTCELERVNEDNAQLRAAIMIYREVVRRTRSGLANGVQSSG